MSARTDITKSYGANAEIAFVKHLASGSGARDGFATTSIPFDGARDDT